MQIQKCVPLKRKSFSILTNWCTHPSSVQIVWNYPTSQTAAPPTHPLSLCQTHSPSQHSKNQLCWNEFNPQVSTVTPPHAHLRAPGGAEAWLMTWPLHGPRMTSSWGSRHLARRNSQRDVKVLPSEAHRGLRGVPLHSMLHSLSWSTRRNCRGVKKWGDKQRKHFLNQTFFSGNGGALHQNTLISTKTGVILEGFMRTSGGGCVEAKTGCYTKKWVTEQVSIRMQYNFLNLFQRFYHNQVEHPFRHTVQYTKPRQHHIKLVRV